MKSLSKSLVYSLLAIVFWLGCTYNFKGFTVRDIYSIAIPVFENKTIKYGLEETFTKYVIDAFIKDNRLKVVDRDKAESILIGEIVSYNRVPFSYDGQANVKDYKIELSLKLTYKDKEGKVILEKQITDWYAYSSQETEESGIEKLCEKLASDILRGILEGF